MSGLTAGQLRNIIDGLVQAGKFDPELPAWMLSPELRPPTTEKKPEESTDER